MTRLQDITKKYPFMYEVNGEVYCMGQGVFHICTDVMGLEYFNQYGKEVLSLGRDFIEQPYPEDRDVKNLVYYYGKVITYSEPKMKVEDPAKIKGNLLAFLDALSPDVQEKLSEQLEDYIDVFRHYNRSSI